jgi:hypothetical protein
MSKLNDAIIAHSVIGSSIDAIDRLYDIACDALCDIDDELTVALCCGEDEQVEELKARRSRIERNLDHYDMRRDELATRQIENAAVLASFGATA